MYTADNTWWLLCTQ